MHVPFRPLFRVLFTLTFGALALVATNCSSGSSTGSSDGSGDGGVLSNTGDSNNGNSSDNGNGAGTSATLPATGRLPGTTCKSPPDGGARSGGSSVCGANPALPGCQLCLGTDDPSSGEVFCQYVCRMGMQDCPSGKTCITSKGRSHGIAGPRCLEYAPNQDMKSIGFCQ